MDGGNKSWLVLLGMLLMASLAAAQTTITGNVYSADGKTPALGATIVLKNPAIGFSRTATTDGQGNYVFDSVPPASGYDIEAVVNGKTIASRANIDVLVGQSRIVFPPLIRDQVESPATPARPVLQVNLSPSYSENITRAQLRSLPLFNRNFLVLGLLSPGVHNVPASSPLAGATFSISGGRPENNNFLLDGTNNVASSTNQAVPFQVNDAIQEFRVIYSNAPAEYGIGRGGVVEVVTNRARRSGSQRWHGSGFGYFGSDALNAGNTLSVYSNSTFQQALLESIPSPFDSNPQGTFTVPVGSLFSGNHYTFSAPHSYNALEQLLPNTGCTACGQLFNASSILAANGSHTQPLNQKQFGANVGGSITHKLFIFGSYEGTLIDNPNQVFERVPTAFDRSYTDSPTLQNNPSAQFAQKILNLYPQPNVIGVPGVLEFFKGQAPNFTHVHNLLYRTDYTATANTTYLLRYNAQLLDQLHDDSLPASSAYAGNGADRKAQNQSVTLSQVYSSAHGWLSDLRFGLTQFHLAEEPQDASLNAASLGLPARLMPTFALSGIDPRVTGTAPGDPGAMGGWFDSFWNGPINKTPITPSLDGQFPFARIGAPLTAPSKRIDTQGFASDSIALRLGRHAVKFGGEFRYLQNLVSDGGMARGLVVSNNIGEFTHDSESCISCRLGFINPSFDYALRQPSAYAGDLRSWTASGYIQDHFRLHHKLTIDAGLRYDPFSRPHDADGELFNFDSAANGLVREGSSQVVDPFGFTCGVGTPRLDSLYPFRSATTPVPWVCNPHGTSLSERQPLNFAPRLGFAYAPVEGKTVIRGGAGLYFDHQPVNATAQLLQNRPTSLNLSKPSAIYGQNFLSPACGNQQCGFGNISLNPGSLSGAALSNLEEFQAASGPPAIYALDQLRNSTPVTLQYSAGVQQQLGRHFVAQASYLGAFGYRQPVLHNTNFQDEFFCTSSAPAGGNPNGNCDNISFFPVLTLSNIGSSSYHSVVLKIQGESWHGLRFNGVYTYSHSYDNASSGQFPLVPSTIWNQLFGFQLFGTGSPFGFILGGLPGNGLTVGQINGAALVGKALGFPVPGNQAVNSALVTTGANPVITTPYLIPQDPIGFLRDDYGHSDFDTPQRAVVDLTYDLPFRKGSRLWGGWTVSGIVVAESGQPYTLFAGPAFGEVTQRVILSGNPAVTGNPNGYFGTKGISLVGTDPNACPAVYANPSASNNPLFGGKPGLPGPCTGNSARNQFYGPGYANTDMAVQKKFAVFGESRSLLFRAEFFNLFNHSNFYNPTTTLSNDGFTMNPQFGQIVSARPSRQIQLAARFDF